METSVLRATSEHISQSLPDFEQFIEVDAKPTLLMDTAPQLSNTNICGEIIVTMIQPEITNDFVTFGYKYLASETDRWIRVQPKLKSQRGVHTITFRFKFADDDYKDIAGSVDMKINVLPCEIKQFVLTGSYLDPYSYTIIRDTKD